MSILKHLTKLEESPFNITIDRHSEVRCRLHRRSKKFELESSPFAKARCLLIHRQGLREMKINLAKIVLSKV